MALQGTAARQGFRSAAPAYADPLEAQQGADLLAQRL
jgi:hypothetical protein